MIRVLISVFILTVLTNPGFSHASEGKLFDRMDVFELEWVSNPQLSSDGRRVVYNRNSMDVMKDNKTSRLWVVNADGSDNLPLTGRDVLESNAVWSPDGSRIAYTHVTPYRPAELAIIEERTAKPSVVTSFNKDIFWPG